MNNPKKEYWKDDKPKIEPKLTLEEYARRAGSGNLPDDSATILEDIKTYHPDRFYGQQNRVELSKQVTDKLLKRLKALRLGEEQIPEEFKRFWPTFREVLNQATNREQGFNDLYQAWTDYKEGREHEFYDLQKDGSSGQNLALGSSAWDKFLSLTFFLDTVLGHSARLKEMGVQRDLDDPEVGFFIPEELLGDDRTREWHEEKRNFDSFAMLPGSDVLFAVKKAGRGVGVQPYIYTLTRNTEGKYILDDRLGYKLLYRTGGGLPLVEKLIGRKIGVLDPSAGKLIEGYQPDFTSTGRLIDPDGRYITEGALERKLLAGGKKLEIKGAS